MHKRILKAQQTIYTQQNNKATRELLNERRKMEVLTPIKAIRAKCLDCSLGQVKEVRECVVKTCALYPYRMGHRPKSDNLTDAADDNKVQESTTENTGE